MKRDRIENAIRHIQTAVDINPWARDLAVEALKAQLSEEDTTSDCISRQAAIEAVSRGCQEFRGIFAECEKNLNELPPVQPEIIRCKECINHGKEICYFWSHFYGTINTSDDGFCHKAERRTDGN